MFRVGRFSLLAALLVCACASSASADVTAGVSLEGRYVTRPSIFQYGWKGHTLGAANGLAIGYLATGSHFQDDDWKPLLYGTGIGALTGMGTGLILGIVDSSQSPDIPGAIVLRDMSYGSGLGTVAGLIAGALVAVESGNGRDVLVGTAIGTVAGTGVGLVVGMIDAASQSSSVGLSVGTNEAEEAQAFRLNFTVGATPDRSGEMVWMPMAHGQF